VRVDAPTVKVLVVIPHYFDPHGSGRHGSTGPDAGRRIAALSRSLLGLRETLGPHQAFLYCLHENVPGRGNGRLLRVNDSSASRLDIVICTAGHNHLVGQLLVPPHFFRHQPVQTDPMLVGFACRGVLKAHLGQYDYYCYMEDDLLLTDSFFLLKLAWFNATFGDAAVLLPHRFETSEKEPLQKLYIDGPVREDFTAKWQDINDRRHLRAEVFGQEMLFERWPNPHSGCFFLNARQMEKWAASEDFAAIDCSFAGPLESAVSLGIMKNFRIYKPSCANAGFFEVRHLDNRYLGAALRIY
jgi:hypothetical protein